LKHFIRSLDIPRSFFQFVDRAEEQTWDLLIFLLFSLQASAQPQWLAPQFIFNVKILLAAITEKYDLSVM
jgi:hypothetical protein